MQYISISPFKQAQDDPASSAVRHVIVALSVILAVIGLTTHHMVIAVIGLIATLAMAARIESAGTLKTSAGSTLRRADGGSFPGSRVDTVSDAPETPKVLDGGSMEHRHHIGTEKVQGR